MMTVLITGGAGFVGSNLTHFLAAKRYRVRVLDDFSTGRIENIKSLLGKIALLKGDICDEKLLAKATRGANAVIHLAAQTSVGRSVENPIHNDRVNMEGTLKVLLAAKKAGVDRVIFTSSCAVYGDSPALPKKETMPVAPLSPYGSSKLAGELYCRTFTENFGLKTVILRPFNIFGPRQNPKSEYTAVIPKFTTKALRDEPLTIYGDGSQTRDFIFVEDLLELVQSLLHTKADVWGKVFNAGSGKATSIKKLALLIPSILGKKPRLVFLPSKPGDVKHSRASISLAKKHLGFANIIPFNCALKRTVDWYVQNQS